MREEGAKCREALEGVVDVRAALRSNCQSLFHGLNHQISSPKRASKHLVQILSFSGLLLKCLRSPLFRDRRQISRRSIKVSFCEGRAQSRAGEKKERCEPFLRDPEGMKLAP